MKPQAHCEFPLVTVVIPAFNAGRTLQAALSSVLAQTYANIEILVGDDASTDTTGDIVTSCNDIRVRLVRNQFRMGAGATRDRLLREAKGEWLAFIDADDAWTPDRLGLLMEVALADPEIVVFDDLQQCHEVEGRLVAWSRLRGQRAFGAVGCNTRIPPSRFIDSRSMLIQPLFSAALLKKTAATHGVSPYGEDIFFLLELIAGGAKLVYIPIPMYLYRVGHVSATANIQRYSLLLAVLQKGLLLFPEGSSTRLALDRKIRRVERQQARLAFGQRLKQGQVLEALALARERPSLFLEMFRHNGVMLRRRTHRLAWQLGLWADGSRETMAQGESRKIE